MKGFTYPSSTLPVSLTAFSASLNNNKVDLTWSTASEINVSHFVVEKSTDGTNYNDAGIVFAYGTATGKADYKLSDNIANDQAKIIYYRLRSVDIDGKGQLSATRIIRRNNQEENKITILTYPNPVSNELRITVPANWQNKKAVYEVFNANGQIAKRREASNSSQTETINVTNLVPGFYIVRVSCEGQIAQQKIVKH
ncbi:MAG: T9SS type A sorting domain-containing protein [Chitinophagaceae bacterium]|nr:T9SS type A sorting domain-containing protein [Chitinophagaceae bacterium]